MAVSEYNFSNLRYADDTVLISKKGRGVGGRRTTRLLDTMVQKSKIGGLSLNKKKTEVNGHLQENRDA